MQVRHRVNRRNRNAVDPAQRPIGTDAVAASSVSANKWRLTFSCSVQVRSLPTDFKVAGASPTAFTVVGPNIVDLTFAVNVAAGQAWTIPNKSIFVRTLSGGYVAAATDTF